MPLGPGFPRQNAIRNNANNLLIIKPIIALLPKYFHGEKGRGMFYKESKSKGPTMFYNSRFWKLSAIFIFLATGCNASPLFNHLNADELKAPAPSRPTSASSLSRRQGSARRSPGPSSPRRTREAASRSNSGRPAILRQVPSRTLAAKLTLNFGCLRWVTVPLP